MNFLKLIGLTIALFAATSAAGESYVGIVLIHGKGGNPSGHIAPLVRALSSQGFRVSAPSMPWSKQRAYDADYSSALAEIEAAANSLREKGAKKIIVGGHSLGANAAIAYAASGRDVDGVIAIAPGHVPDSAMWRDAFGPSVEKARQMIAEGKGDTADTFADLNQGKSTSIQTTAKIYLSYFDPEGLGSMPSSVAKFSRPIPFLWVIGTKDRLMQQGEAYAFARAPKHSNSKYLVVEADHLSTPTDASAQIVEWLRSLGY